MPRHPPSRPVPASPPGSPLPDAERAELHRQGAKAAARGDAPSANPMDAQRNRPEATGEPVETWRDRQAAWQKGHRAQSQHPPAPPAEPDAPPGEADEGDGG